MFRSAREYMQNNTTGSSVLYNNRQELDKINPKFRGKTIFL